MAWAMAAGIFFSLVLLPIFTLMVISKNVASNFEENLKEGNEGTQGDLKGSDGFLHRMTGPLTPDDPQLLEHVRERYLTPPSNEPYNLENMKGEKYVQYGSYREVVFSWSFLDRVIKTLFRDEPPGFFVEAGALDGEYLSNTLDLERLKGWNGLLVEVDEDLFQKLKKKNRKAWISNSCLATHPYPHQTILNKFTNHREVSGSFDLKVRGFNALMESKDLQQRFQYGLPIYQPAQCLPLQTLLLAINVSRVDFVSLDVEGVEMEVLQSFFDKNLTVIVDVWLIEHKHPDVNLGDVDKIHPDFIKWFQSKGYTLYTHGNYSPADYIFIRNGSDIYERAFAARPPEFEWMF